MRIPTADRQPPRRPRTAAGTQSARGEEAIRQLAREVAKLRTAIEVLSERIAEMESNGGPATTRFPGTAISDGSAKRAIKVYFEKRHGETVYPSDVADELNLDYDSTVRLISQLERDGQVARA